MLSAAEKKLIASACVVGPEVIRDHFKEDDEKIQLFLKREDVVAELTAFGLTFNEQDQFLQRARFGTKLALIRMVPQALEIIRDAARGFEYAKDAKTGAVLRDKDGNAVVLHFPPTPQQVQAARDILDRVGVHPNADDAGNPRGVDIAGMFFTRAAPPEITYAPDEASEQEKILARERLRTVFQKLAPAVQSTHKRIDDILSGRKTKAVKSKTKDQ